MGSRTKKVRVGEGKIDEAWFPREIELVKSTIRSWAEKRNLWHDSGFATPFLYHDECPSSHDTLLLISGGPLGRVFDGDPAYAKYDGEFRMMLMRLGYWCETENHYTASLFPECESRREDFMTYYRWQWLKKLATERMISLHHEISERLAKSPGLLTTIEWRKFEEVLDAIFRNQGFHTELGLGSNDGNVNLRLYQDRAIPEIVTLVQTQRYGKPVRLDAVAALFEIDSTKKPQKAIYATTSCFQPAARDFSNLAQRKLVIPILRHADEQIVTGWCTEIAETLTQYFRVGLARPPQITENTGPLAGRILVANEGNSYSTNYFARIEADFPREAVVVPMGREIVTGSQAGGTEIPVESKGGNWFGLPRFLARKTETGTFLADRKSFTIWNGEPQHFSPY
jgi:restriction system protein